MFHQGELRMLAGAVALFLAGLGWNVVHASAALPPLEVRGAPIEWSSPVVESPQAAEQERPATQAEPLHRATAVSVARIDPNSATVAQLESLPGVGPALASRIVEARAQSPFRNLADLDRVKGIGPAKLEKLGPHLQF